MGDTDAQRTIRLMADYGCSPLWEPGTERYPLDPEDLPLTPDLRACLWKWAETYDNIMVLDNPASSDFASEAHRQRFVQDGAHLAERLRSELGDHFNVNYFDRY